MKHGFTIIELMIALMISSLVAISLYQMFFQTSKTVKDIVRVMQIDEPIYPLYSQLQHDITGMFAPRATIDFYLKSLGQARDAKNENSAEKNAKQSSPLNAQPEEEKETNLIKNVFFIETNETGYLFLSFITTGGISQLEPNGKLAPQDFVRRVAYIIEKSSTKPNLLTLSYRVSYKDLGIETIKKPEFYPSYKIFDGIKNVSVEFVIFEPQNSDKKDQAEKSSRVLLKEWKEGEIFEKYKALLPAYVTIKGLYADEAGKVDYPFEFSFKVYSYANYELIAQPKSSTKKDQEKDKPAESENIMDKITKFFENAMGNNSKQQKDTREMINAKQ